MVRFGHYSDWSRRRILAMIGVGVAAATTLFPGRRALANPATPGLPPLPASWDKVPRIPLWPDESPEQGFAEKPLPDDYPHIFVRNVARPELRVFVPAKSNGRAVLVIPGGAYTFVSILNEGIDVAGRLNARGYTVFVLVYRLPDEGWTHRDDVPLQDAQRAMRLIRARATQYRLDPAMLSVIGFSAGGHLAASLATGYAERLAPARDAIDALNARPATVGLVYPVISLDPAVGHAESTARLLGTAPTADAIARRSPALHVAASTPPIFLIHALDDPAVPAENSAIMMRAMQAAKRPVEAHFFERGGHGFGIGAPDLPASAWPDLYLRWSEDQAAR